MIETKAKNVEELDVTGNSPETPQAIGNFNTGSVAVIAAAHATHDSYTGSLPALLPVLVETIGITKSQSGLLGICINFPSILQPFIGYLADHTNLRIVIILAPAVTAVLMSQVGIAPNFLSVAMLLILVGLSSAGFHAIAPVVAGILSGKQLGRGMSFMMVGGELGRTLGPLIVVTFLSFFSIEKMPFLMMYGLIVSGLLYLLLKDVPYHPPEVNAAAQPVLKTVRQMGPVLIPLAAYMALRSFIFSAMTTFLPMFLTENGASLFIAGASLTLFEIAGIAGALAGGSLSDVFGRRRILLASILLTPLLVLLFLYSGQWIRVPLLLLIGFFLLSVTPVLMAIVQESYPDNRSLANGSFMVVNFLTNALGLVVIGFAGDRFGLQVTYLVSAVLMLLGTPLVMLIPAKPYH